MTGIYDVVRRWGYGRADEPIGSCDKGCIGESTHLLLMDMKSPPCLFILSLISLALPPTLSTRPFVAQMQHWMLLHHALHNCSFQANLHHGASIDRTLPPPSEAFWSFSTWVRGRGTDRERKMNCAGKWSEDGCHKQMECRCHSKWDMQRHLQEIMTLL